MLEELFAERTTEAAVEFVGNDVGALRALDVERHAARVFQAGHVRSAWQVGQVAPKELLARARAAEATAVPAEAPEPGNWQGAVGAPHPAPEAFHAGVERTLAGLREALPGIGFTGKAVQRRIRRTLGGNALDAHLTTWNVTYRQHGSINILDGFIEVTSTDPGAFEATLAHHRPYLAAMGREVALPAGRVPVMYLDPGGPLLGRIAESLRIDRQEGGSALFGGRLGEAVFHPEFGLDDVSLEPAWGQVEPFDGEGVVRPDPRLVLIEGGVPRRAIAHTDSARRHGVASTGNARRTFGDGVALGFHALALHRGQKPYHEILAGLPRCVVVFAAIGGATSLAGAYAAPVNLAFLVEHGEVAGRLPPLTLTAPIQEVFGSRWLAASADGFGPACPHPCLFAEVDLHPH